MLDDPRILRWRSENRLIKFCPETAGGLPTPRPAAEFPGGAGQDVLNGIVRVTTADREDISTAFINGAQATLELTRAFGIKLALLKSNSPSCGNDYVYNGSFDGTLIPGEGITTTLLRQNGIRVFNEFQLDDLEQAIAEPGD